MLTLLTSLGVFLIALTAYRNNDKGDFCYDDAFAIVKNRDVDSTVPVWPMFEHDFWGQRIDKPDSHKSYRPLTTLSFRFDHFRSGGLVVEAFRWTNNVLHASASALLTAVLCAVFGVSVPISGVFGAFFAIHAVHAEAVAGIVGRAEMLASLGMLAGMWVYHWALKYDSGAGRGVALLCMLAATFAKESGFAGFGVLFLMDVVASGGRDRSRWAPLACVAVAYLLFRVQVCGNFALLNNRRLENPIAFSRGWTKVLSTGYLHARYVLLLLAPYELSFDYSFNCIPLITSMNDPRNLATVTTYIGLIGLIVASLWIRDNGRLFLALAFFGGPFAALSNVFFDVGSMIAERLLYLPSLGFCAVGAVLTQKLHPRQQWLAMAIVVALTATHVPVLEDRIHAWGDEELLVRSGIEVCPDSAKSLANYGHLMLRQHKPDEALAAFRKAHAILPTLCEQHVNIAGALLTQGNITGGIAHYHQGATCLWTMLQAAERLRDIYSAVQSSQPNTPAAAIAMRDWATLVELIDRPDEAASIFFTVGSMWSNMGRHHDAFDAFRKATHIFDRLNGDNIGSVNLERGQLALWYAHAALAIGNRETALAQIKRANQDGVASRYREAAQSLLGRLRSNA